MVEEFDKVKIYDTYFQHNNAPQIEDNIDSSELISGV